MIQGWVWHAWATENDGWLQFNRMKRKGKGFVGQEVERLLAIAKANG